MGHSVLVVDDDEHIRQLESRVLRMNGFDVDMAADGQEAIAWWPQHSRARQKTYGSTKFAA